MKRRRIFYDRPHKNAQITPISYIPPLVNSRIIFMTPMDSDDVDLAELEAAVNEITYDMCQLYNMEAERRKKLLPALNPIFRCYLPFRLPLLAPFPVSSDRCSDGRAIGPAEVQETIVEIKNE
jgi:hypothetical protein